MQISHVEITPVQLHLRVPYRTAYHVGGAVEEIDTVFVRIETRQGQSAWGCAAFDPSITGETLESVMRACADGADRARDLNPLNTAYALAELEPLMEDTPSALCAFDIAFHDLLGLAAGQPLYRLLGGFRDRIRTSITVSLAPVRETVELAKDRVRQGFRLLKIKGGREAGEDVERVRAVRRALPNIALRLDADGGYTVAEAIGVAQALEGQIEMLEQPVAPAAGFQALREVRQQSPIPILADQSASDPASALAIASERASDGLSIKLAACGGILRGRQMDAIARAARLVTMVGCVHEPALLIAAELALALSSPAVRYGDLDGHLDLVDDPTRPRFRLVDGWLIASDVPGIGCTVEL